MPSGNQLAQLLGRNQGPELFDTITFNPLTSPQSRRNIPLNRPLERLELVWRGRVVVGVANYTTVAVEAPQTIVQRILVQGTSTRFGAQTLIDLSGATAFAWMRITSPRGSSLIINNARQPELSTPVGLAGTTFGNIGTYDLEIHYDLPFAPVLPVGPLSALLDVNYALQKDEWQDSLTFQVYFGDKTSFGTPGGTTTVTFSSFGSGAGNPLLYVETNYDINGEAAGQFPTGVVLRSEKAATGDVTAITNNLVLLTLQKRKTTNVVVKTGTVLAGTSGGVVVFQSLSDAILDFTQVQKDNKPVRNIQNNFAAKEYYGKAFETVLPQGYLNLSFVDSQNASTFLRADIWDPGVAFTLNTNVISAGAGQACNIIQEQVLGDPQGAGT